MDTRHHQDPETLPWKVSYQDATTGQDKVLAAFRLEATYQVFIALCYQATPADIIKYLVKSACRQTVGIEEAGIEGDVLQERGKLPYIELLEALQAGIAEVLALKEHTHEYVFPDDGSMSYCRICRREGAI